MADAEKMEVDQEIAPEEEVYEGIDNPDVFQKYKSAAQIVNETLAALLKEIKVGAKLVDLCEKGDKMIAEKTSALFKKKKSMQKGVAFPTCINVNNIVCHFSPMDQDQTVINANDQIRIDLGAHVDGFIAVAATTVVVKDGELSGKEADALAAANTAVEAALRTMKPGKTNTEVTNVIQKVATTFGVNPAEGVLSHQLKKFVIDGNNVIILKPSPEHQVEEFAFQENEVYSLDVVLSTGPGKLREVEPRTTIYKRQPESHADLKRQSSRQVLNDITAKYATMPFTLRNLDKKIGRIGILELYRSGLVDAYPVLCERQGEFVAQIKTTVFITATEVVKGTSAPLQAHKSDKSVTDKDLLTLLKSTLKTKKKEKKAKAPAAATSNAATTTATKEDKMDVS